MNIVEKLQKKYTHGMYISQEEWRELNSIVEKVRKVERKELYLKENIIMDRFLEIDIEKFELMCDENSNMLTTLINLSDYLEYKTEGNSEIFESPEQALEVLDKCLENIEKNRSLLEDYLLSDFD